jgi:hypothetical protein
MYILNDHSGDSKSMEQERIALFKVIVLSANYIAM